MVPSVAVGEPAPRLHVSSSTSPRSSPPTSAIITSRRSSPMNMNVKTKRVRASKPKVKSGCITCKIRRVKCDEGKPGCLRCQKFGRECDGYVTESPPVRPSSLVPLKPRPSFFTTYTPAFSVPGDERERRYYQLFCDETAPDLSGFFPTDFWTRTVLQESHSEPSIRHAIVALGALTKTLQESKMQALGFSESTIHPSLLNMTPVPTNAVDHHQYALTQYNKAIVSLRQTLARGKPQLRTALIACLLFVCFENFHGDNQAASRHTQSGLGLLDQWQAQLAHSSSSSSTSTPVHSPSPNPSLSSSSHSSPSTPPSVLSDMQLDTLLNDEVFQMFARLDAHPLVPIPQTTDPTIHHAPPRLLLCSTVGPRGVSLPSQFSDLYEARNCADFLLQRCARFHQLSAPFLADTPVDAVAGVLPEWLGEERDSCAAQLQAFEEAFWPLLGACMSAPCDPVTSAGATVLYLNNKINLIQINASLHPSEAYYDTLTADFGDIVTRALPIIENLSLTRPSQRVISGMGNDDAFAFEAGLLPALHLTALKCRQPKIRRQAIALLLSCPRREGAWDGNILGRVDAWVSDLEESTSALQVDNTMIKEPSPLDLSVSLALGDELGMVGLDAAGVLDGVTLPSGPTLGGPDLVMGVGLGSVGSEGFVAEGARWRLKEMRSNRQQRWVWARVVRDGWDRHGRWGRGFEGRETRITW